MDAVTVACVLRSGGDFLPWHVSALRDQVAQYLPGARFVCLSDVPVDCERVALAHDWRGWWSKMELCRPDIDGDLLAFDLDTVIVGELDEIAAAGEPTLLRDFYKPHLSQSGMMFLPESTRALIWQHFKPAAPEIMHAFRGDGEFLHTLIGDTAQRWQSVVPGQVVSYKADIRGHGLPRAARVVCFHGRPRPWYCNEPWVRARYPRAA